MKLKYKIIKKSDIMSHSSFKILKSLYNLSKLATKSEFFIYLNYQVCFFQVNQFDK